MTHEALTAIEPKMQRATEAMERDFAGIRTGRASTALVERIVVDYYGAQTPLNQLAGISTPDPHLIVIQPWDRSALSAIEKAKGKVTYVLYPDEGHGFRRPENSIDFNARAEAFLGKHLGGRVETLAGDKVPGSTAVVKEIGQ